MLIDVRLPGGDKRGIEEAVSAVSVALQATVTQPSVIESKVVCDWIQYRNNFRVPIAMREIVDRRARLRQELAVDLRRVDKETIANELRDVLAQTAEDRVYLESWVPLSKSCIWQFNAVYWQELAIWETAAGRGYAQALPGGQSGGTNLEATRSTINDLFRIWDVLAARQSLPEQLTVLELGIGNGEQARVWLDEFLRLDIEHGSEYYRRLQYLMGDYSAHVLDRARITVGEHKSHVSTLVLDAARPSETLRFLESKVFFVYISNVYDNLPSDEVAVLDDRFYLVESRAFLACSDVVRIAKSLDVEPDRVKELAIRLFRIGPSLLVESTADVFPREVDAAQFWQEVWSSLRLEERYVPLGPLDLYEIAQGMSGEMLAPLLDGYGDVRVHISNGAIGSFIDTLSLIHPLGSLVSHDLFVTDLAQYGSAFRGPGKYDGSVVNWVNGPLLQAMASSFGFHVEFNTFIHGSKSPIVTATARARD